ncbi:MAG: ribonuclease HI, partial [Bdellovibrionota bacterium]
DGACSGNPGPGGWAAILVSPLGKVMELGGAAPHTTNNKMELTATSEALLALTRVKTLSTNEVKLYTDSKYVIQGITEWIHGWKRNNWKTSTGGDVSNKENWEQLLEVTSQFKIEWLYVPGHSGFAGNERCDEIAVAYSKNQRINLFKGDQKDYRLKLDDISGKLDGSARGSTKPKAKKGKALYLSYVDGKLHRDADWKSCEARVKGKHGAKFKRVDSPQEEDAILFSWGLK